MTLLTEVFIALFGLFFVFVSQKNSKRDEDRKALVQLRKEYIKLQKSLELVQKKPQRKRENKYLSLKDTDGYSFPPGKYQSSKVKKLVEKNVFPIIKKMSTSLKTLMITGYTDASSKSSRGQRYWDRRFNKILSSKNACIRLKILPQCNNNLCLGYYRALFIGCIIRRNFKGIEIIIASGGPFSFLGDNVVQGPSMQSMRRVEILFLKF